MDQRPEFGLSARTLHRLREALRRFPQVHRAVVYGSRAKGNHKPGSDIDLALYAVPGQTLGLNEVNLIAEAIEQLMLPYMVDLSAFDLIDNPALREHIERVGRVLYVKEL